MVFAIKIGTPFARPNSVTITMIRLIIMPLFVVTSILGAAVQEYGPVPVRPPAADRIDAIASMLDEADSFRQYEHAEFWAATAQLPGMEEVMAEAEAATQLPDADLEEFERLHRRFLQDGNRSEWEAFIRPFRRSLRPLVLAECIERSGRFLPVIEARIADQLRWPTWVASAHDRSGKNLSGEIVQVDLYAAIQAAEIAASLLILEDQIDPQLAADARTELRRRILGPFRRELEGRQEASRWLTASHNWSAVCMKGIAFVAIVASETPHDRAWHFAAIEDRIENFLSGFESDGLCTEGVGYWDYGYGRFIMLSELLRRATGGGIDLFARPQSISAARFPFAMEMSPGRYPAFGDCDLNIVPSPAWMWYIDRRLGLEFVDPAGIYTDWQQVPGLAGQLLFLDTQAFPQADVQLDKAAARLWQDPLRGYFPVGDIFVVRSAAQGSLAASIKGRHNDDHHNHNDVGSFVVSLDGVPLLCDPGREFYNAKSFNPEYRYQSPVYNSYGHPVPVVAGQLQGTGREFRAEVVQRKTSKRRDRIVLDLIQAYSVPSLQALTRTLEFDRKKSCVTVADSVSFTQPESFETALITYGQIQRDGSTLTFSDQGQTLVVTVSIDGAEPVFNETVLDADWLDRWPNKLPGPPTRIGIACDRPVQNAVVRLDIRVSEKQPSARRP